MEVHGRQFVAGPGPIDGENMTERSSFGTLRIGFHKRLPIAKTEDSDCEFLLLGHVIDPERPALANREIVQRLVTCTSFQLLESELATLGGRFLLFARIRDVARLYPDAAASKSAFYKAGWIASQPGHFGCPIYDGLAAWTKACTWPVGETPFEGVRQLLPNHYLDLGTFQAVRFGPKPIVKVDLDQAVHTVSRILEGTISAVLHRGPVALPITGGYDSRTLLSAAFDVRDRIQLFTVIDDHTARHDYVVPNVLARRVGRSVRFVRSTQSDDVSVNTCGLWRDENQSRLSAFAQADLVLLGHLSEICRCFYWKDGVARNVTPTLLSRLAGFDGDLQDSFARWINSIQSGLGIETLDMFYWESRAGIWSALCCTALDGYCDVISPYNCRLLIETGLGVDPKYRCMPYEMHQRLCRPELRAVPFNETWLERAEELISRRLPWRLRAAFRRVGHLITSPGRPTKS